MRRLKDYSYDEYLAHQIDKKLNQDKVTYARERFAYDLPRFKERFTTYKAFIGGSIICLGARLGTEVRVLRDLGHEKAIGIDIGRYDESEELVIYMDMMKMDYADHTFDFSYTNSFDHAFDPRDFIKEVSRVMKPGSYSLFDISGNESDQRIGGDHIWIAETWEEIERILRTQAASIVRTEAISWPFVGKTYLVKWHTGISIADRFNSMLISISS